MSSFTPVIFKEHNVLKKKKAFEKLSTFSSPMAPSFAADFGCEIKMKFQART